MKRCKNFHRYKGIRKPRCNGGRACDDCKRRFAIAHCDHNVHELKVGACKGPYDPTYGFHALHCTNCGRVFTDLQGCEQIILDHLQTLTKRVEELESEANEPIWRVDVIKGTQL